MTLMEVMGKKHGCPNKNGCARSDYDYCAAAKCGPCDVTQRYGGACTVPPPPNVDVDKETEIVNSMTKEELLDVAAEMMMDEYMYDKDK